MPATRVIIDVQPDFVAANKPNLVVGVTTEILKAKKERSPIIFLEYRGYGKTHSGLMNLLDDYYLFSVIQKNNDDGSAEVLKELKKKKYPRNILRVCGVNTDCCVVSTIRGLEKALPDTRIRLVKSACECSSVNFSWHDFYRNKLMHNKNIRIV